MEQQAPVAVVIEDDPDVSSIIATVLGNDGFAVVECPDGFAGVAAVEAHRPVVTTCDIHMPGMDGYAVLKRIRTFDDSYVIMISSMSEEIDIIRALEAGADDYLTKPFSPRELRARVHAMLRRAQGGTPEPGGSVDLTAPGEPLPPAPVVAAPPAAPITSPVEPAPAPASPITPSPEFTPDWLSLRGLQLHLPTRTTLLDDRPLALAAAEFDLLATLTATAGETRPAADLTAELGTDQRGLEQAMVALHRTLGPGWIVVVPGVGLRMRR